MSGTLEDILYSMWEECGRKKTEIATDMGKNLSTLSRELSPYDSGAKFGAIDLIPLMRACGAPGAPDIRPLVFLAQAFGKRLVDSDGSPRAFTETTAYPLMADLQLQLTRVLDVVKRSLDDDGKLSKSERVEIFSLLGDFLTFCQQTHAGILPGTESVVRQ